MTTSKKYYKNNNGDWISIVKTKIFEDDMYLHPMTIINLEELVPRTIILYQQEYGQKFRARIDEAVNAHEDKVQNHYDLLTFSSLVPFITKRIHMVNTTTESNKLSY